MNAIRRGTLILATILSLGLAGSADAQVRKARVGDRMEPFTLSEIDGEAFGYEARGRASIVAFLASHQTRSERAIKDLARLTAQLHREEHPVDLLLVISGGDELEYFRAIKKELAVEARMLIDIDDALWGRIGVIVTPTTLLLDRQGRITWIRAGHSFDYATEAQTKLDAALGLAPAPPADDAASATPVDDLATRVRKHRRLAQVLAYKGDLEAAITELREAEALDPDSMPVRLQLAHVLCRAERPEDALAVLETARSTTAAEIANAKMLGGWASRELGDLDRALALLTESLTLDPSSGRTLYELGRVHEARGDWRQAADAYRKALAAQFDDAMPPL